MKNRYIKHIIKTKGTLGSCFRLRQIIQRFGITSKKIEKCLDTFINISNEFSIKPTLCVTAILFERYPELIKRLNNYKAELGFHGYKHIDYKSLTGEEIKQHIKKAKEIFGMYKTPLFGFRFPYLSWDERVLGIVRNKDFIWSSNQVISWNVIDKKNILKKNWENYQRVLDKLYVVKDSSKYLSLPKKIRNGFVEIPISVPDDEIIIDRLNIYNSEKIYQIWHKILKKSYDRGELFTLQTHHERVPFFKHALRSILNDVNNKKPKIWSASLQEIAEWWNEKDDFNFQVINYGKNNFTIKANCSDRATILVKKSNKNNLYGPLFDNYQIINEKNFDVSCAKKPFIGIPKNSPQELSNFLHEEGFKVEVSSDKDNYAVYLENYKNFNSESEKKLLDIIERSPFPLIRFWRWPNKSQSAFVLSGDIDGITILDFIRRYSHFKNS